MKLFKLVKPEEVRTIADLFVKREWPSFYAPDGNELKLMARVLCDDPYSEHRAVSGNHAPLRVIVANYSNGKKPKWMIFSKWFDNMQNAENAIIQHFNTSNGYRTMNAMKTAVENELAYQKSKWGDDEICEVRQTLPGYVLLMNVELCEAEEGWAKNAEGRDSSLSELVQVASLSVGAMVAAGLYDNTTAALNAVTDEAEKQAVVPDGLPLPLYILSVRTWLHELTKDVACGSSMYLWNTLFNIYATVSSAVVQYGECGNPR